MVWQIKLAPLNKKYANLKSLNRDTLTALEAAGAVTELSFAPVQLDPGERLVFILDHADVPAMLSQDPDTHYVAVDLEGLAEERLFVVAETESEGTAITVFGIVNQDPYDPGPERCAESPTVEACCRDYDCLVEGTRHADALFGPCVQPDERSCVFAHEGQDYVTLSGAEDGFVALGEGDDFVFDSGGGDTVVLGGAGSDSLNLYGGEKNVRAGTGHDFVFVSSSGESTIRGDAGDDALFADDGDVEIDGGSGADYISSGSGDDIIAPGSGLDVVDAGSGNDTVHIRDMCEYDAPKYLHGGPGEDTLFCPPAVPKLKRPAS